MLSTANSLLLYARAYHARGMRHYAERIGSPSRIRLSLKTLAEGDARSYNVLQRLTYLLVVFVFFPVIIWTGLGMSPAVASAIPAVDTVWGGQQSARTIHFFVSLLLVLFLLVHVLMVYRAGFRNRTKAMIWARSHDAN